MTMNSKGKQGLLVSAVDNIKLNDLSPNEIGKKKELKTKKKNETAKKYAFVKCWLETCI